MKHSTNAAKAHANLKQALEHMLKVLKNLNDSLHEGISSKYMLLLAA